MRVTIKGQVTVPKALRERFGITTDTEVEFREERGKLVLVKKTSPSAVARLRGRLKRLPGARDVDDYLRLTRGDR
jgi:AbrB family looped-hinge helix DNA binding protein